MSSRTEAPAAVNPLLVGFKTLDREISLERLEVRGRLPGWLSGTLVRNGPGRFEIGELKLRHWFDGFAMLHAFSFAEGKVSYANRMLQSRAYRYAVEHGKLGYHEFATDPCRSLFQRIATMFSPPLSDNAMINVSKIADSFVALTELPLPVAFDPRTLETMGIVGYEDPLKGHVTTAHPHHDPARREALNYLIEYSLFSKLTAYRLPDGSRRREAIGGFRMRHPSYMHSFAMTENYLVFAAFPFVVDPLRILLAGKPFIENYRWEPDRGTIFHVMRGEDGRLVGSFRADPFFAFHHVNAFEEGNDLLLDISCYPDASIIGAAYLDVLRGDPDRIPIPRGELRRYRIGLENGRVSSEVLFPETLELPRMDYGRLNGRPYRFAYGVGYRPDRPNDFFNRLIKVDAGARSAVSWAEDGCYPGEPVFVPAPGASGEDKGVALSVVLDAAKRTSFLLVLDAVSFQEIARAEVLHPIPFGFHGQYFS